MLCLAIQHLRTAVINNDIISNCSNSKKALRFPRDTKIDSFALNPRGIRVTEMSRRGDEATVILTSGASGRINALISIRAWKCLLLVVNSLILILLLPFRRRRPASASLVTAGGVCQGGNGKDEKHLERKNSGGGGMIVCKPSSAIVQRKSAVEQEVAARRALAIKRVLQDVDNDVVRDFALFVVSRGATLFTQSWTPVYKHLSGLVVLLHGLNEHSGRYSDFAKHLNANGYKVYGLDWIGHGGSDGLHAYVHSLDDAVSDTKSFIRKVVAENPRLPCFCFGHSTGGAIILKAVLDPDVKALVAGVVVTSPAVGVQPSHPILYVVAPVFSFLLPRFQFSAANKRGIAVSRDPEALLAKYSDPLVFTGSIRVRTGYEILRITANLQQNLKRITTPFFVLHGTADSVTDPNASQKLYEEASSTDKTMRMLDGLLHDLLFEPEKDEIVQEIVHWLNQRT